jgi:membrane protease YdiL (CAAX protease family)
MAKVRETAFSAPPALPVAGLASRPVVGFLVDLLLAIVLVLGVSVAGGVLWTMVRGVQLGLQAGAPIDPAEPTMRIGQPGGLALIGISIASTASAALVLYFWRRRATVAERATAHRALRRPATWVLAAAAGIATFVCIAVATALAGHSGIEQMPSNLPLIESVGGAHPALLLVFAVLLAPACEELLFRRVLFGRLWAAGRPWLGLVLSSIVFALMHELPGLTGNDWPATVLLWACYAAMGAVFAWIYWRTGTLWAAILAHAVNNLLACTLLLAGIA